MNGEGFFQILQECLIRKLPQEWLVEDEDESTTPMPDLIDFEDTDDEADGAMMVNSESEQKEEEQMTVPIPVYKAPDGCTGAPSIDSG